MTTHTNETLLVLAEQAAMAMHRALIGRDTGSTERARRLDAEYEAARAALASAIAEVVQENARLVEDRARFPDRPDDIGRMIGAHHENLKAAAKANEDAWRAAQLKVDVFSQDAARIDWLLPKISGKEWRRIGVNYGGNCDRSAIDAARSAAQKTAGGTPAMKRDLAVAARFIERMDAERQVWIAQGKCPDCHGEGVIGGQFCGGSYESCEACGGTGKPQKTAGV